MHVGLVYICNITLFLLAALPVCASKLNVLAYTKELPEYAEIMLSIIR